MIAYILGSAVALRCCTVNDYQVPSEARKHVQSRTRDQEAYSEADATRGINFADSSKQEDSRGGRHTGMIEALPQLCQQLSCSGLPAFRDRRRRLRRRRADAALLRGPPSLEPPLRQRAAAADHTLPGGDPDGVWGR